MSDKINPPLRFVGCDVGKAEVVFFDASTRTRTTVANTPASLKVALAGFGADTLVVCEATGGYEAQLLAQCLILGVPVHRADARKVKAFIRSFGTLGKTDAIDAAMLARYGCERHGALMRWQARGIVRDQLQDLVHLRVDFIEERKAYTNRLKAPRTPVIRKIIERHLRAVEKTIDAIEAQINQAIASDAYLTQAAETLRLIPGIGDTTAIGLIALMPELGTLSRKQAAALAGLAPHPNQSGSSDGYRRTKGGRPDVKRMLFMATLVSVRHSTPVSGFYNRLVGAGKTKMVALVAAMRKLVIICNAVLKPVIEQHTKPATQQLS